MNASTHSTMANTRSIADEALQEHQIQIAADSNTVWVHSIDGSTVGRFSRRFGMDVHTTVSAQLDGAAQCLHCTHTQGTKEDWLMFVHLMKQHYNVQIPLASMLFGQDAE